MSSSRKLVALDVPAFLGVVLNGTIRTELAHFGSCADALLDPFNAVLVRLIDKLEGLHVWKYGT